MILFTSTRKTIYTQMNAHAISNCMALFSTKIPSDFHISNLLHEKYTKYCNKQERIIVDKYGKLKDDYKSPKYPVVLCHGFFGFDRLVLIPSFVESGIKKNSTLRSGLFYFDYWYGIKEELESRGTKVLIAKVPPFGTIEERSTALNDFLTSKMSEFTKESKKSMYNDDTESQKSFNQKNEKIKVNLIGHSMGGLDCRYLISQISQTNFEVVSLTTVSTPHHGSEMANYVKGLNGKVNNKIYMPPSINELTTDFLKDFNAKVIDDPKVKYFSYGARFIPHWYNTFAISWKIIHDIAGDNDGMVSVESAKWGKYLGTLDNVDHLDLINWTNTFRRVWGDILGKEPSKFNAVALYLDIADQLAKEGL